MTANDKRKELKQKIQAGEQRHAARSLADSARAAGEDTVEFVKRHPLATLAGAIAVGLAIGAMTKPGRRLGKRGGAVAALITDAAIAYGMKVIQQAGSAAREGQERFGDLSGTLSERLAETGSKAGDTIRALRDRIAH